MSEGRRFCESCGTEISQTTNFCPNCGAAQRFEQEVPISQPPPASQPPPPPSQPPPAPEQRRGGCFRTIGGVAVILVLLAILVNLCEGGRETSKGGFTTSEPAKQEKAQKEPASKQKEEKAPADPNPNFGDGTHQVGQDIQAGTYRTRKGSAGCYYARLSGFSGDFGEILANDNTSDPAVVTIQETDAGFESKRCGTWTQDLSPITQSTTSLKDGAYIVGTDIEPGTYRSSGGSGFTTPD